LVFKTNKKDSNAKVDFFENTDSDVASSKQHCNVVLEELENARKLLSSAVDGTKDLAGACELFEESSFALVDDWRVADVKMFRFP